MSAGVPPGRPGRLLVVEGADGTGKTTQLALLGDRLRRAGRAVAAYDFPAKGGTPVGELIGAFLRGEFGEVAPEFLALAFSADRMASRDRLLADLAAGRTVLCDRYVASNIAFQCAKIDDPERRRRLERLLVWFEYEVLRLPMPDLQVVLLAPDGHFTQGRHLHRTADPTRAYVEHADIHERQTGLQLRVNAFYRGLAPSRAVRAIEIEGPDGRRDRDALADLVWDACRGSDAAGP